LVHYLIHFDKGRIIKQWWDEQLFIKRKLGVYFTGPSFYMVVVSIAFHITIIGLLVLSGGLNKVRKKNTVDSLILVVDFFLLPFFYVQVIIIVLPFPFLSTTL
jgi:hypothetical protein